MQRQTTIQVVDFELLPLCETSRYIVPNPVHYASNIVYTVGALRLIERAP